MSQAAERAQLLPEPADPLVRVGERFGERVRYDAAQISAFSAAAHDHNPLHHDAEYAARTRFGGLIASGTQTAAILLGLTATHFSRPAPDGRARVALGMDFSVRFAAAVPPDTDLELSWVVDHVRWHPRLAGWITQMEGRARFADGRDAVRARGTVLVTDRL